MARTSVVKNLGEAFVYGILNPFTANGLIKSLSMTTMHLVYDNLAVDVWVIGDTITGGTSNATGIITYVAATYLLLDNTSGTFEDNEQITGGSLGTTADVNGAAAAHIVDETREAGDVFVDADDGVTVRAIKAVKGTTDTVITVAKELAYDGAGANPPNVGETLTGDTSTATGVVVAVYDSGGAGWVTLNTVDEDPNPFANDEDLSGSVSGAAFCQVNGTLQSRTATFVTGDPPDETKEVTVSGPGLSTTLVTGGAEGQMFEILRALPSYGASDYILYCTAKTQEEGMMTVPVRDKGQLQHRKNRADIERRLSLTVSYVNSKTGLLNLVDQDIILIAERDDDRKGVKTEYHYFLDARINMSALPDEAMGDDFSSYSINARFERALTLAG